MDKKLRYTLLDVLRGGAVVMMVIYHALWDLVNIFYVNIPWFGYSAKYPVGVYTDFGLFISS